MQTWFHEKNRPIHRDQTTICFLKRSMYTPGSPLKHLTQKHNRVHNNVRQGEPGVTELPALTRHLRKARPG